MNDMELTLAVASMRDRIPAGEPLEARIRFAMRYAREHESEVFWMSHRVTDDLMLRAALGAVMVGGSEGEKDLIKRSVQPMRMLSAAMSGIPVDFSAMETEGLLPLMKWWHESGSAHASGVDSPGEQHG